MIFPFFNAFFPFFYAFIPLFYALFPFFYAWTRANNSNLLQKWGISLRPRLHRPRAKLPELHKIICLKFLHVRNYWYLDKESPLRMGLRPLPSQLGSHGSIPSDTKLLRKEFPENYSFVIFEGICTFKISGKDIFQKLRVRFANFQKIIISEQFFVSNNFVSEGIPKPDIFTTWITGVFQILLVPQNH